MNYSKETIKEWMECWLGTAQRCKGVIKVHWGHKDSQTKVNPNKVFRSHLEMTVNAQILLCI